MPYKDPVVRAAKNKEKLKQHYAKNKPYYLARNIARNADLHAFIASLKKTCSVCGNDYPPAALEGTNTDGNPIEGGSMKTIILTLIFCALVTGVQATEPLPRYQCFIVADRPQNLGIGCYLHDGTYIIFALHEGKQVYCAIDAIGNGNWKTVTCEELRAVIDQKNSENLQK